MILVHFKVLMLSQSEEPHRIFDHDAQVRPVKRNGHHAQTGHLYRDISYYPDGRRRVTMCSARCARNARGARAVDNREQRESSKMMCETSWGVPESKRASSRSVGPPLHGVGESLSTTFVLLRVPPSHGGLAGPVFSWVSGSLGRRP